MFTLPCAPEVRNQMSMLICSGVTCISAQQESLHLWCMLPACRASTITQIRAPVLPYPATCPEPMQVPRHSCKIYNTCGHVCHRSWKLTLRAWTSRRRSRGCCSSSSAARSTRATPWCTPATSSRTPTTRRNCPASTTPTSACPGRAPCSLKLLLLIPHVLLHAPRSLLHPVQTRLLRRSSMRHYM